MSEQVSDPWAATKSVEGSASDPWGEVSSSLNETLPSSLSIDLTVLRYFLTDLPSPTDPMPSPTHPSP